MRYNRITPPPAEKERVRAHIARYSGYEMTGALRPTEEDRRYPLLYPQGMETFARAVGISRRALRRLLNSGAGCSPANWNAICAQIEAVEGAPDPTVTEEEALKVVSRSRGIPLEKLRGILTYM